ncbi:MAG: 3-deoxy-8-phosphooctulonate synthase [Candidatus Cloacimonetes bacterium]|nr:3-deoxy-8-phosphooctulonate synthase [Candidatus Cloacimonadota bacterium]
MKLYNKILHSRPFFLIAGPCVIENYDITMRVAEKLTELTSQRGLTFIYKSSYLKANRTSESSFSGLGQEEGLKILSRIKHALDIPILTDIHEAEEADITAEVADIIQIPAFLSRQTFLLKAAARTNRIVNIKKGQFMAPEDMSSVTEKILAENNSQILLTERGTFFGYHNLVVDFRSFPIMKQLGYPVVFDITHSLQMPSISKVSGGTPELAPMMAKAGLATGMVDGLFLETHPEPAEALSDGMSMIKLELLSQILDGLLELVERS